MSVNYTDNHALEQKDDEPFEVQLSEESFETYNLDPPSYTMNTTKKDLKQMYYDMVAVRCVTLVGDTWC